MDPRLTENWEELSDFIVFRDSLDLGALSKLMDSFTQDNSQDPISFAEQVMNFLATVTAQAKRSHGEADALTLLAIDALISNMYSYGRAGEAFQPNSSSFYGWMSSSQMSADQSGMSEREGQLVPEFVAGLANSQPFFKRLRTSIQKSKNQETTKNYVQGLLETIDLILSKERLSRQTFLKYRGKHVGLQSRRKSQIDYNQVNTVIFSSQLNKVMAVLTQGSDSVHLALLRVFLGYEETAKIYEGVRFSGEEMLVNLYRYYISSFRDIGELFQQGKHPIFRFLRNHLTLLFTPVLRRFHQLVVKIAPRCGSQSGYIFYKTGLSYLESELSSFINQLPGELLKLLLQLKDLIEEQHPGESQFALIAVKKMFFSSFLLNQALIEELYSRHDPSMYEQVYTHVHNLFFQSSIKKYGNLLEEQQTFIGGLIDKVATCLDGRIMHQYIRLEMDEPGVFQIRENILNHDYQLILAVLASLEFTPKDSKQFEMRKICPVAPESPVYRHLKTTGFKSVEMQEELELATWMSVGGSYEWGVQPSRQPKASLSSRLQNIKGMDAGVRSGLSSESAELLKYFNG